MKKLILCALVSSTAYAQENPYKGIPQRNAFDLTSETAKPILPPVAEILRPTVFLTGITHHQTIYQAHLVSKSSSPLSSRFLSLSPGEQKDNIKVIKITKSSVVISNNGSKELLTFKDNGLPTVRLSSPSEKRSSSGKSEKRSRPSSKDSKSQSPTPPPPRPQIVRVPSRRPQVDPRIIERGLEYISKINDPQKKNSFLERIEKYQKGE